MSGIDPGGIPNTGSLTERWLFPGIVSKWGVCSFFTEWLSTTLPHMRLWGLGCGCERVPRAWHGHRGLPPGPAWGLLSRGREAGRTRLEALAFELNPHRFQLSTLVPRMSWGLRQKGRVGSSPAAEAASPGPSCTHTSPAGSLGSPRLRRHSPRSRLRRRPQSARLASPQRNSPVQRRE